MSARKSSSSAAGSSSSPSRPMTRSRSRSRSAAAADSSSRSPSRRRAAAPANRSSSKGKSSSPSRRSAAAKSSTPSSPAMRRRGGSRSSPSRRSSTSAAAAGAGRRGSLHAGSKLLAAYLVLYNAVSALLWLCLLVRIVMYAMPFVKAPSMKSLTMCSRDAFFKMGRMLSMVQSVAMMEILHSMLGLVPSSVVATVVQVHSRILVGVFLTQYLGVGSTGHWGFMAISFAWSLADFVRYFYYVLNAVMTHVPYFVIWMRYSLFLVLYPLGTCGEMALVWQAAHRMAGLYRSVMMVLIVVYPLGLLALYAHMLRQRGKYLSRRF